MDLSRCSELLEGNAGTIDMLVLVVFDCPNGQESRNVRSRWGHGGTLDPLATGVLVIGIGSGTKHLQHYLQSSKKYKAGVELGFETDTLDMQGQRVKEMEWTHVREEDIQSVLLQQFTGTIMQKPPLYSAIQKNGKRLYEQAREGKTEADLEIEARPVEIYNLGYYMTHDQDGTPHTLPCFGLDVECGGGTYIRSLVRDLGNALGTCASHNDEFD